MSIIFEAIKDFIWPRKCVVCGRPEVHLCPYCRSNLKLGPLTKPKRLTGLFVKYAYKDLAVKALVAAIKFSFNREVVADLQLGKARGFDMVVPLPLHWFRQNWRGFNQAETLARAIGEDKVALALKRIKNTRQQAKITSKQERKKNLENAFAMASGVEVKGKKILLVDDVYTTGESMGQAAKVLKKAGAKEVWGWILAG